MTEYSKNITIVVCDDEEIVVSLVHDALEDDGYTIYTCTDSHECLDLINSEHIDLLISDIRMPKMNGIELAKKAREIHNELQIIFMTGYANLNSAKEAIKQGVSDYILKPFELHEIRQAVIKAVGQIEREAKVISTEKQLDQLTNLNEILYTGSDKDSQIQMSLKFAAMSLKANHGSFLTWNTDRTEFKMISLENDSFTEKSIDAKTMNIILDNSEFDDFSELLVASDPKELPFFKKGYNPEFAEMVVPEWKNQNNKIVLIMVSRQDSVYGFIMIELLEGNEKIIDSKNKFLLISSHQLAMSLENLQLLEESQDAYRKLKQLQDDTINLEKMATRGEMSAEIGHELNNFLGVVVGSLSLLEHQIHSGKFEKIDKHLSAINENIDKIKKFTSNLMELRPISTKQETICFRKMLNEVIEYLIPQKRYRGVQINFDHSENRLPFEADALHIQQLLYNLFNNAADAMKNTETKIMDIVLDVNKSEEKFKLFIQDTGVGIEPKLLQKAFNEKFTTKETGHGFGLLVCKRIIESHHGTLNIESEVGKGTNITIEFPIKSTQDVQSPALV
ncbi:MAG: response regulator [Calditrichaeota bacterium]|nr:MAG: response regulator [Calditrichota bacterium]